MPARPKETSCKRCGATFLGKWDRGGYTRFCSRGCRAADRRAKLNSPQAMALRLWSYVDKAGPEVVPALGACWIWTKQLDRKGYGRFRVYSKNTSAHRAAWFFHHGAWPAPCALHRCDNRKCVRPDHLFEGTNQENVADRVLKGRLTLNQLRGESNTSAKLTEAIVTEIRVARSNGVSLRDLSRKYGVGRDTISEAARGVTWRHVACYPEPDMPSALQPKDVPFLVKFTREEAQLLRDLSLESGLNRSDVLRQLIRKEHAAVSQQRKGKRK